MLTISFEIWVSIFFLVSLVLVYKLRGIVAIDQKNSLNTIATGLMVLAVTSLMRLYDSFHLFSAVPFLSDPLFFRLANWIGVITGIVFTASGVSQWLPVSREYLRYNRTKVNQLSLIACVQRLISVESRTEIILRKTLEQMDELFDLSAGAVFVYSREKDSLIELARFDHSAVLPDALVSRNLLSVIKTKTNHENNQYSFTGNIEEQAQHIIPISPNGKNSGLFLLFENENELNEEAMLSLQTAVDAVTRMIERKALVEEARFNRRREECGRAMESSLQFERGIKENIPGIVKSLKRHLDFDFFSLTMIGHKTERYAVGTNGSLLNEIGLDNATYSEQIESLMVDKKPIIINNLENNQNGLIDELLMNSGMKSLIAFPLTKSGRINAVVMLASTSSNWFSRRDALAISPSLMNVNKLITSEQQLQTMSRHARSQYRFTRFLNRIATTKHTDDLIQDAANLLADEIGTTMVRISTIDDSGAFSDSRALVLQLPIKEITPVKGHMIMSLMPLHREVIANRQLMLINQDNRANHMDVMESSQALFKDMKSALLIPICHGDNVLGVISMGEKRSWARFKFERQHIQLAESVAAALALCLTTSKPELKEEKITTYDWPLRIEKVRINDYSNSSITTDERLTSSKAEGILG